MLTKKFKKWHYDIMLYRNCFGEWSATCSYTEGWNEYIDCYEVGSGWGRNKFRAVKTAIIDLVARKFAPKEYD